MNPYIGDRPLDPPDEHECCCSFCGAEVQCEDCVRSSPLDEFDSIDLDEEVGHE